MYNAVLPVGLAGQVLPRFQARSSASPPPPPADEDPRFPRLRQLGERAAGTARQHPRKTIGVITTLLLGGVLAGWAGCGGSAPKVDPAAQHQAAIEKQVKLIDNFKEDKEKAAFLTPFLNSPDAAYRKAGLAQIGAINDAAVQMGLLEPFCVKADPNPEVNKTVRQIVRELKDEPTRSKLAVKLLEQDK